MKKKLLFQLTLAMMTIMAVTSASAQDCLLGTVYNDLDLDCVQDPGEAGIPGVTMVLISSTGIVTEQITNDTGFYLFCGLVAGDYILLTQTGSPNLEPNPATQTVTVPVDQSIVDVDVCVTDLSLLGVIAGSAFIDLNANGLRDIFEPCLVDFPVTLVDGVGGSVTINTDAQGMFRFTRLPSDSYVVSMVANIPNTEWVSGPSLDVGLMQGQIVNNIRFVRRPMVGFGSIIDVICFDLNADGLNDPLTEPPLGGIPVQLLNLQGMVLATSVSDSKGVYSFIGIPPGEYRVQALFNPEDYTPTTPTTYDVILPVNEFRRPGPFYGQPLRKIFKCGMAASTFGSERHGTKVLAVKDIRDRSLAPVGVGTPWVPIDISKPNWDITTLGEIFGIALDEEFNLYVSAATIPTYSDVFSIANGKPLIYRIEPYTGTVSGLTFAAPATTVGTTNVLNNNTGLGNICSNGNGFLYATNLSDGNIVVIGDAGHATPGQVIQNYDVTSFAPGSLASWRFWGIGYNKLENRLYFSAPPSAGTVRIYSILLTGAGTIPAASEQFEFSFSGNYDIADIAFSQDGVRMLIAERGINYSYTHNARVFQYFGSTGSWGSPQQIYVGGYGTGKNSAGGIDYAYESFPGDAPLSDECEPFITASGDALNLPSPAVYGYSILPASGNLQPTCCVADPADFVGLNGIIIDNEGINDGGDKAYVGDVEVFDCPCRFDNGCDELFDLVITPTQSIDGHCCLILDYTNNGSETVYGVELVGLDGVTFNNTYTPGPGLITPNFGANNVTFIPSGFVPMPAVTNLVNGLCVEDINATPQYILVNYLDAAYQVFCTDTIPVFCEPEQTCLYIVSDTLVCDSLGYKYIVNVSNPAAADFSVGFIKFNITPPIPGATYIPNPPEFILSPALAPGDTTMLMFWIQTNQDLFGDSLCFILSAHDGPEERLCCAEIDTCIAFPLCDPCPYVDADIVPVSDVQAVECCFELIITDTFTLDPTLFQSIQTTILTPGITFNGLITLPALLDGWNVTHLVTNTDLLWTHNSGMVPNDIGYNLFDFCVEGTTSTDSIYIAINWIGADSTVICTDTLAIYCPFCLTVINDTLTCLTTVDANGVVTQEYVYTFQVQNFSPFPVNTIGIVEIPSGNTNITPDVITIPTIPAFPPGGTSIPISIVIDGSAGPISDFCFDIVLRQVIQDSIDITCCYATHCIELPPCDSLSDFLCPDPALVSSLPCTLEFFPVCGCNDVTYSNICRASNAGVTIWTPGVCDSMMLFQDPRLNLQATLLENFRVQLDWGLIADRGFEFFSLLEIYEDGASKTIATLPFSEGLAKYDFLDEQTNSGVNRYRVIATNSMGIPIFSNIAEIFVQDILDGDITLRVFPVPASNRLFVASSKTGFCDLSILHADGRVMPLKQYHLNGAPVAIDISGLPAGAYSVQLRYTDGVFVQQRFVKVE
ncbi:MAG: SdrD B-like domain-containing protein [Saprospiraceae bacterium]|nr:SdrD B-like domain-containing protein [Saprospiraceae bacterium]